MEELEHYTEIATQEVDPSNGAEISAHMDSVSTAISRVQEIAHRLEEAYLRREHQIRRDQEGYDFPEAKLKKIVEGETLEEYLAFKRAKNLLLSLHNRFRSLQSSLSFLKAEMRM